ncbi:hypothetical protein WN48_03953 [Eufriesea mexicana]|nr:hypothetical protein WN48_03953 [Eufriesea mexicana]
MSTVKEYYRREIPDRSIPPSDNEPRVSVLHEKQTVLHSLSTIFVSLIAHERCNARDPANGSSLTGPKPGTVQAMKLPRSGSLCGSHCSIATLHFSQSSSRSGRRQSHSKKNNPDVRERALGRKSELPDCSVFMTSLIAWTQVEAVAARVHREIITGTMIGLATVNYPVPLESGFDVSLTGIAAATLCILTRIDASDIDFTRSNLGC